MADQITSTEATVRVVAAEALHVLARALYVATAVVFVLTVAVFVHRSAVIGGTAPWPAWSWFLLLPSLAAAVTLSLSARGLESTPASRLGWSAPSR